MGPLFSEYDTGNFCDEMFEGPGKVRSHYQKLLECFADMGEGELERKREMCLAYNSQGDFLQRFDIAREIVRPQIKYDYTRPPHEGKTNYEAWQWSMTARDVCAAFTDFLRSASKQGTGR